MLSISEKDRELLKKLFDSFDEDSSGALNRVEFKSFFLCLMRSLFPRLRVDDELTFALFDYIDKNSSGSISFCEFGEWWLDDDRYEFLDGKKKELFLKAYRLFNKYKTHENNFLTDEEFNKLLKDFDIEEWDYSQNKFSFFEFWEWLEW